MRTQYLIFVLVLALPMVALGAAPTLTVAPTSLLFGTDKPLGVNAILPYSLSGSALSPASGNITVTAPTGCSVSLSNTSGFATSISVAYSSSALAATTIYVMFSPTSTTPIAANVTNAGGGATTVNVAITGTGGVNSVTNWVRPTAGGNWSALSWEATTDVGATWSATSAPTGSENIVIPGTYTVTVDGTVSISGYLKDLGIMPTPSGTLTIASGGTYELGHATATSQGIPTATWSAGSTCLITGITSATTGINATQAFYNLTVNCPNWSGSLNLGWNSGTTTISGNVTVKSTGSGRWQFCAPAASASATVTINGNLVVDGSASSATALVGVTSNGTSNAGTTITINIGGNVTVTGNASNVAWTNFSLSRGTQGGTGTTAFNLSGNFSMSNATTQNSTTTSGGANFVFARSGTQTLTLSNVTYGSGGLPIAVNSGSTLSMGTNVLGGGGNFTLNSGATLECAHASGINGVITTSGTISLSTGANYIFDGSSAQVTGALLPATVNNLTINNLAGVTLGTGVTVSGTLTMTQGNIALGGNTLTLGTAIAFPGTLTYTAGYITGTGTFTRWYANGAISGNAGLFPMGVGSNNRSLAIGGSPSTGGPIAVSYNDASTVSSIAFSENAQNFVNRYDANWAATPSGDYTDGAMTLTIHGDGIPGITDVADLDVSAATTIATGVWAAPSGSPSAPVLTRNGLTQGTIVTNHFYIASVNTSPLPVELTSFSGSANGRNVQLLWATATEINNSGFEVQKAIHSGLEGLMDWQKVGFVDGAGTSNAPHSYSFSDVNSAASTYSYRLKQIDRDGKFTYSNAIEVTTTLTAEDFKLSQNYPNPFNPSTKFSFAMKNAERVSVRIYDVVGKEVTTLFNDVAQPDQIYTLTFDAKNLPSGTYFYVLHSASRNEVKKMMLLK